MYNLDCLVVNTLLKEVCEWPLLITAARLRDYRTLVLSTLLIFLDSFLQ